MRRSSKGSNSDKCSTWKDEELQGSDGHGSVPHGANDPSGATETDFARSFRREESEEGSECSGGPGIERKETPEHWDSSQNHSEEDGADEERGDESASAEATAQRGEGARNTQSHPIDPSLPDTILHANFEEQIRAFCRYFRNHRQIRVEMFDQYYKRMKMRVRIFQQILVCITGFCQSIWWSPSYCSSPKETGPCFFEDSREACGILEPISDDSEDEMPEVTSGCMFDYLPSKHACRKMIYWMMELHSAFLRRRFEKDVNSWWVWPTPLAAFVACMLAKARDEGYPKKFLDKAIRTLSKKIVPLEETVRTGRKHAGDSSSTGDDFSEFDDRSYSESSSKESKHQGASSYTKQYEDANSTDASNQHPFLNLSQENIWSPLDQQFGFGASLAMFPDLCSNKSNSAANFDIASLLPSNDFLRHWIPPSALAQPPSSLPHPPSSTPNPFAALPYPLSSITHPPSSTPNSFPALPHPPSSTSHPFSALPYPSSSTSNPFLALFNPPSATNQPFSALFNPQSSTPNTFPALPLPQSSTTLPFPVLPNPPSSTSLPFPVLPNPPSSTPLPFPVLPQPSSSISHPPSSLPHPLPSSSFPQSPSPSWNPMCAPSHSGHPNRALNMSYGQDRPLPVLPAMGNSFLQNSRYRYPPPGFDPQEPVSSADHSRLPHSDNSSRSLGPYSSPQGRQDIGIHPPCCPCRSRTPYMAPLDLSTRYWSSPPAPSYNTGAQPTSAQTHHPPHGQGGQSMQMPNSGPSIQLSSSGPSIQLSSSGPSIQLSSSGPSMQLSGSGPSMQLSGSGPSLQLSSSGSSIQLSSSGSSMQLSGSGPPMQLSGSGPSMQLSSSGSSIQLSSSGPSMQLSSSGPSMQLSSSGPSMQLSSSGPHMSTRNVSYAATVSGAYRNQQPGNPRPIHGVHSKPLPQGDLMDGSGK